MSGDVGDRRAGVVVGGHVAAGVGVNAHREGFVRVGRWLKARSQRARSIAYIWERARAGARHRGLGPAVGVSVAVAARGTGGRHGGDGCAVLGDDHGDGGQAEHRARAGHPHRASDGAAWEQPGDGHDAAAAANDAATMSRWAAGAATPPWRSKGSPTARIATQTEGHQVAHRDGAQQGAARLARSTR